MECRVREIGSWLLWYKKGGLRWLLKVTFELVKGVNHITGECYRQRVQ